jgi:small neutral amino acid transporter SnatA (MarC family)
MDNTSSFFGISIDALRIAGGIIIVSSGFHYFQEIY